MNTVYKLFEHGSDAVFGINTDGIIRYLNKTCEKLLAISRHEAEGSKCASLLCGHDLQGNKFCGDHCPIPKTVDDLSQAASDFDLVVKQGHGDTVLVNIGVHYVPADGRGKDDDITAFFSLRRVSSQRLLHRMHNESRRMVTPGQGQGQGPGNSGLTPREVEILDLAANGLKTNQIAQHLSISKLTVGNHFKNIYPKIGVHSRAQAVSFALRHRLIRHHSASTLRKR